MENNNEEIKKVKEVKQTNYNAIIMTILLLIIIAMTSFIINDKFLTEPKSTECNCPKCVTPKPTPTAKPSNNSETEFEIEISKAITKTIKLGDKTIKLEAGRIPELEQKDDIWGNGIAVDGKVIYKVEDPGIQRVAHISIIENDVIMAIVELGDYVDNGIIVLIDKDGNIINKEVRLEKDFYMAIKNGSAGAADEHGVKVEGNKILVNGSRQVPLENKLCVYNNETHKSEYNKEYEGQVYEAKYEIEYLGNNKFSEVKRVEVLQTIDESLCK